MSIELRPGDFVAAADIEGEEQYLAIGEAFVRAGARAGEFPSTRECRGHDYFGWCGRDGMFHSNGCGVAQFRSGSTRRLTPAQILDAEPSIDVTRIATEPPAWDGEGLPPVGYTHKGCETVGVHYQDFRCFEVLAHRAGRAIVWVSDTNRAYDLRPWHFRPIRSEEDRAVEEIRRIACSVGADDQWDFARALYRAGLRFPEQEKEPTP